MKKGITYAHHRLGWSPKIDLYSMVREMTSNDLELASNEKNSHSLIN